MATKTTGTKAVISAIVSGAIAFLSALATALQGPTAATSGLDSVTAAQWVTALLAFLVGLGVTGQATYRTSNRSMEREGAPSNGR